MADYVRFLERINAKTVLKSAIENMLDDSDDYLNLTHSNWLNHLKNDAVYQRHMNGHVTYNVPKMYDYISIQNVNGENDTIKALVIARCNYMRSQTKSGKESGSFYNSRPFLSANCSPPLDEIRGAFKTGAPSDLDLSSYSKFFLPTCVGPKVCYDCYTYVDETKFDLSKVNTWLCVSSTKIFNGHVVLNITEDVVTDLFKSGPVWAVLKVEVNCRQFFGGDQPSMKISGTVHDLIFFKENALSTTKSKRIKYLDLNTTAAATCSGFAAAAAAASTPNIADGSAEKRPRFNFAPLVTVVDSVAAATRSEPMESGSKTVCVPSADDEEDGQAAWRHTSPEKQNVSYRNRSPGFVTDTPTEDESQDLDCKTVCLPPEAVPSFLKQKKQDEGEYDVAFYTQRRF